MYFSIVLHTFLLFGVVLVMPAPGKAAGYFQPLQVVLVNSKSIWTAAAIPRKTARPRARCRRSVTIPAFLPSRRPSALRHSRPKRSAC
jgi:hypothetical protein